MPTLARGAMWASPPTVKFEAERLIGIYQLCKCDLCHGYCRGGEGDVGAIHRQFPYRKYIGVAGGDLGENVLSHAVELYLGNGNVCG